MDWDVDPSECRAATITLSERSPGPVESLPWSVAELHARATARAAFPIGPDAAQVRRLASALPAGCGLVMLPDDLVDRLLPAATARTLTGPAATELTGWLRLSRRHPRRDVDGLSAQALRLSALEARGLGVLGAARPLRAALAATGLDRWIARASAASPRGTVVALWADVDPTPERLGELGEHLLATWLAGERAGWRAHPLSELLDDPSAAEALEAWAGGRLGRPAGLVSVWRWGRPTEPPPRSPRLTD